MKTSSDTMILELIEYLDICAEDNAPHYMPTLDADSGRFDPREQVLNACRLQVEDYYAELVELMAEGQ